MSSLSFQQERQQQETKDYLPSPPNSSCGDEKESEYSTSTTASLSPHLLPENYTIEHSSSPITTKENQHRHSTTSLSSHQSDEAAVANNHRQKKRRRILSPSSEQQSPYHQCVECGKAYKHPNCLVKHRWEHSEGWKISSQFLLTKHQKVQLLEAAAILINMTGKKHPLDDDSMLVERKTVEKEDQVEEEDDIEEEEEEDSEIQIDLDDDL